MTWQAVPRLMHGLIIAQHESLFRRLTDRHPVPLAEIMTAADDHLRALAWFEDSVTRQRTAQLFYTASLHIDSRPRQSAVLIRESIVHQEAALAGNPSQPYAWTQLAIALAATEGLTPRFIATFKRSIESGRYAAGLRTTRISLGLQAWPFLDLEVRDLLREQSLLAARHDPESLVQIARRPTQIRLVRSLLANHPEALRAFDRARAGLG